MILALNPREKVPDSFTVLNVTSRSKNWGKNLSPFFLGPIETKNGTSQNVENAWQFSKVYREHTYESPRNKLLIPTNDWHDWMNSGFQDTYAHRYPMGKGKIPVFSFYESKRMGYVEARKKIYIPLYLQGLRNSDYYIQFIDFVRDNKNIAFIDFDVYNNIESKETLEEIKNNPKKRYGHGFVLAEEAQRILNK